MARTKGLESSVSVATTRWLPAGIRINAKKTFCASDVIPAYEANYRRVLEQSLAARG